MNLSDYDAPPPHYSRDPVVKRRLAEHRAKWQSIRALRDRMSKADLAEEAKAFLARRDANVSALN